MIKLLWVFVKRERGNQNASPFGKSNVTILNFPQKSWFYGPWGLKGRQNGQLYMTQFFYYIILFKVQNYNKDKGPIFLIRHGSLRIFYFLRLVLLWTVVVVMVVQHSRGPSILEGSSDV